ncbi:FG-GAP-like repeat-containing protein [Bradyrhizobium sp. LjRoot220]|uniref:beta strand repeat-containing protein n=1 Tax=Bradyrhizobium sp. LjRoot220 TaxID=3342284 RepID=UPI003ECE9EB1
MTFSLTQTQYSVGANPAGLAVGDINGDGRLDIVTSSPGSLNTWILFGNGDGTFGTAIPNLMAVPSSNFEVALGDLNGDGKLELVASDGSFAQVAFQVPHGGPGPFYSTGSVNLGAPPSSMALIDVNGDGRLDIVSQSSSSGTVSILLGNGNGTFQPGNSWGGPTQPASLADVNGDGRLDLIGASIFGFFALDLGNGDGTFSRVNTLPGEVQNFRETGDVNGDGNIDIVTLGDDHITVHFLDNRYSLANLQQFAIPVGTPTDFAIADMNGDGKLDYIITNAEGTVTVMLGTGAGGFSTVLQLPVGSQPGSIVLADFNNDGQLDVAVANQGSGTVSILMNHPPAAPATNSVTTNEDTASASVAIGAIDADNDMLSYAVKTGSEPAKGAVVFGSGSFTYTPTANANGSDSFTIVISDGNGHTVEQAVTVTIDAVNDAAVAQSGSGSGTEDAAISGTLAASDVEGAALTYAIVAGPQHGTLTSFDSATGAYTYAPDTNYRGADSFSFKANDGTVDSNTATISLTVSAVNDAPTGLVMITGAASEDQVLTAVSTLADADGLGTPHYQWQRDSGGGFVNVGLDQTTYTLGDADVGAIVRVVVSYTDGSGTAESVTSSVTAAIAGVNDPHTGGVSISGTATENQVLTAVSALADVDGLGTLHYQWQRDTGSGFVNVGADQATYTLGDADVGGLVRVVVSYTDGQGFAESATSAASSAIAGINDPHTGGASISGSAAEDQVLTAISALADVDGLGTLHYQWQRDSGLGYVNVGLDQSTYTLGDADIGGAVRVVVSYTDDQGFAESATSASTPVITVANDAHTGGVNVTGSATENQVLTAVSTLADSDGLGTLHYQWQRNTGGGFANVGLDQATYTLGDTDVGGLIRVVVSYIDGQGFAESATSVASSAIAGVNDPHTGGATISGSATEDQVLTAISTLADVDGLGTLHYQWQHDVGSGYVNVVGQTQATYRLGDADVGGFVRVVVSYTDGQGFAESATSAGTPAIVNVNDAPVNTMPASRKVAANTDIVISGLAVSDVDATSLTTTLHVDHGTLSIGAVGGVTVTGSGSSTVTLTGSVAQINAAFGAANNVLYHSTFDFSSINNLTMTSSDGSLSDADVLNLPISTGSPESKLDPETHFTLYGAALQATAHLFGTPGNPLYHHGFDFVP